MPTLELVKSRRKLVSTLKHRGYFINIYEGLAINSFSTFYWEARKDGRSITSITYYVSIHHAEFSAKYQIDELMAGHKPATIQSIIGD